LSSSVLVPFSLVSYWTRASIPLLAITGMVGYSVGKVQVALFSVIALALFLVIAPCR
jgi:hypothetical protein